MNKRITACVVVFCISFWSLGASASDTKDTEDKKDVVELEFSLAMGGPIALIGAKFPDEISTALFTVAIAVRIGFPRWSWLRLEANSVIGYGIGANILVDVAHIGPVRVHLGDPGLFWNPGDKLVSVSRVSRSYDITFGGGVDWRVQKDLGVSLDWRAFIPDPSYMSMVYGNFASIAYEEALKGGQLWLRLSYIW